MHRLFLTCLMFCASATFSIGANEKTITDNSTKETFPFEVSFEANGKSYELEATGVATRKKLIIKVYSIAHYLQKGAEVNHSNPLPAILSDQNAKQFTIKWVRGVDGTQVKESYLEALHHVFNDQEFAQLKNEIDTFLQFFSQGSKKGDEFVIRWIPPSTIAVLINGKSVGTISNPHFATGIWDIWFGDKSVVDRQDLVSAIK